MDGKDGNRMRNKKNQCILLTIQKLALGERMSRFFAATMVGGSYSQQHLERFLDSDQQGNQGKQISSRSSVGGKSWVGVVGANSSSNKIAPSLNQSDAEEG